MTRTDRIQRRQIQEQETTPTPKARTKVASKPPTTLPRRTTSATKCIYFKSGEDIDALERLVQQRPSASVSSIISQLLAAFVASGIPQAQTAANSGAMVVELSKVRIVI